MFILKSLKGHRLRVQHSTSRSFAGFRLVMNFSWINKFLMENFSSRILGWEVGRSVLTSTLEFQFVFWKQLLWVISVISKSNNPETCGSLWSQLQLIYYLVVLISHSSYFHFVWFKQDSEKEIHRFSIWLWGQKFMRLNYKFKWKFTEHESTFYRHHGFN